MKTAAEVKAFVDELRAVCRKHGLSIGHEDSHGSFQVWPFDERHDAWLAATEVPDDVVLAAAAQSNPNPTTQSSKES